MLRKQTSGLTSVVRRPHLPWGGAGWPHQHLQLLAALAVLPRGAVLLGFMPTGATAHVHIFLERGSTGLRLLWLPGRGTGAWGVLGISIHVGSAVKLGREKCHQALRPSWAVLPGICFHISPLMPGAVKVNNGYSLFLATGLLAPLSTSRESGRQMNPAATAPSHQTAGGLAGRPQEDERASVALPSMWGALGKSPQMTAGSSAVWKCWLSQATGEPKPRLYVGGTPDEAAETGRLQGERRL